MLSRRFSKILAFIAIGSAVECVLVLPLLLASHSSIADEVPLPIWVEALEQLQKPGYPLSERLMHTGFGALLVAHISNAWACAQGLALFIQVTLLSLLALTVLQLMGLVREKKLSTKSSFAGAMICLPIWTLLTAVLVLDSAEVDRDRKLTVLSLAAMLLALVLMILVSLSASIIKDLHLTKNTG